MAIHQLHGHLHSLFIIPCNPCLHSFEFLLLLCVSGVLAIEHTQGQDAFSLS